MILLIAESIVFCNIFINLALKIKIPSNCIEYTIYILQFF